jgi:Leucine-rich repeat (LRR) protein
MKVLIPIVIGLLVVGCGKKPANISDPIVEEAIRAELNKPEAELTETDLEKVTRLRFINRQLSEVPKDLEKLPELEHLDFTANQLPDVMILEKLSQLRLLSLGLNELTEIPKGLDKLIQLEELYLHDNQLTDVKGLEKLTQLTELYLHKNKLTGVKGLEKLTQLTELSLSKNQLTDVTGLEKLTHLTTLTLNNNQLTDVKGLEKLTQLTFLYIFNNPDLTKSQITELQKALPKCEIRENAKDEPVKNLTPEERKALGDQLVGTYQVKLPNGMFTMTLQKDGKSIHVKITNSGEKESENANWKIEDGNLLLIGEELTGVMKIKPDGSLVPIAEIKNGVRKNLDPRISAVTSFKKIK